MTAGPAPLTPVPIVVKIPPPIIVPKPMATRSLAVSARRSVLLLLCSRNFSTELVANSCDANDMGPGLRRGRAAVPLCVFGLGGDTRNARLAEVEVFDLCRVCSARREAVAAQAVEQRLRRVLRGPAVVERQRPRPAARHRLVQRAQPFRCDALFVLAAQERNAGDRA